MLIHALGIDICVVGIKLLLFDEFFEKMGHKWKILILVN